MKKLKKEALKETAKRNTKATFRVKMHKQQMLTIQQQLRAAAEQLLKRNG